MEQNNRGFVTTSHHTWNNFLTLLVSASRFALRVEGTPGVDASPAGAPVRRCFALPIAIGLEDTMG